MVTRIPTPGNGRTTTPRRSTSENRASVRSPNGSQTKLACESGRSQPSARRAATTRSRSATRRPITTRASASASMAASDATWARWFTANGISTLSSSPTTDGSATA